MNPEQDRNDYNLRVMIEDMQQRGSSERDIEAAVRSATRRLDHQARPATRRPSRFRVLGRRSTGSLAR